jgi:hypothetical protein
MRLRSLCGRISNEPFSRSAYCRMTAFLSMQEYVTLLPDTFQGMPSQLFLNLTQCVK